MKVSELTGAQLDYWVAKANAPRKEDCLIPGPAYDPVIMNGRCFTSRSSPYSQFSPSTNWAHGGPIIEREQMDFRHYCGNLWIAGFDTEPETNSWGMATGLKMDFEMEGPTPLVAAMRAYVASKFGDEVPDHEQATG